MSAPETIWAYVSVIGDGEALAGEWTYKDVGLTDDTEYTRSDLIPALIAEAVEREREECAAMVDCTCPDRDEVLAERDENSAQRWRLCNETTCGALEAAAIRARGDT